MRTSTVLNPLTGERLQPERGDVDAAIAALVVAPRDAIVW